MAFSGGTAICIGTSGVSSTSVVTDTNDFVINQSVGHFGLLAVVSDNLSITDGATNDHSSVTGGTGTWTKILEHTNSNGAAAAGVTTSIWLFEPSADHAAESVAFTANFSAALVDKVSRLYRFTKAVGTVAVVVASTGFAVDASNGFGSGATSGLSSTARMHFAAHGKEANSTVGLTASTGWTAISDLASRSRSHVDAVLLRTEYRFSTSTGETSNPTMAVSGDTASIIVALNEVNNSIAGTSTVAFSGSGTLTGTGALSGAVTAAFSASGALTGGGSLSGAVTMAFSASGTLAHLPIVIPTQMTSPFMRSFIS